MEQYYVAGQTCRRDHALLVVRKDVGISLLVEILHVLRESPLIYELDDGVRAIDLRCRLDDLTYVVMAAIARYVVPQHFDAALRDRKGVETSVGEIGQTVATIDQLGIQRTLLRQLVDFLRGRGRAVGGIHRNLVRAGIALEHRHLTGGQLVLVLLGVGGSDGEQRLLIGKGIAQESIGHGCCARLQTARPGRDAAVGIGFFLCTQGGQNGAQLVGFLLGNGSHHAAGHKAQRQSANLQICFCFHAVVTSPVGCQKFTPKLSATKSRSPLLLKSPPKKSV
ncbi:hypothetical protein D9M69_489580 [compost metagenome]